jgi:hypothetical protein
MDEAERARRELASAVRRLRVSATSDPQRADELADALVDLTASRLLAWDFSEAATDAPESVVVAARLLASRGPAGPYASLPDAVRYASATAQLAAVQAGLGQPDAAARTLDGLDAWRQQVSRLPLAENLADTVVVWMLIARARSVLTADAALANAWADAAELRLYAMDPPPYLAMAAHLVVADARWAAGRPESSLAHHRLAADAHAAELAGTPTPRPAVAKVAAAPVPALHEPWAARLAATGDTASALAVRRAEVALLAPLDAAAADLALAGLASALVAQGRSSEAAALLPPGRGPVAGPSPEPPGARLTWEPLPATVGFAPSGAEEASARWQRDEQAAVFAGVVARAEATRTEAALRAEAEAGAARRAAEQEAADRRAEAEEAAAQAARAEAARAEEEFAAERARREESVQRAEAERRRRELADAHRREVDPRAAQAAAAELDDARAAVAAAGDDLLRLAAADERLAGLLRPLAAADPLTHADELAAALDALVGLRWRLGDTEGSRAAAREARALRG